LIFNANKNVQTLTFHPKPEILTLFRYIRPFKRPIKRLILTKKGPS